MPLKKKRLLQVVITLTLLVSHGEANIAFSATEGTTPSAGSKGSSTCEVRSVHYCSLTKERSIISNSTPGVLAVRIAACRGDAKEASRFLKNVNRGSYRKADLRFALGNLALLKGQNKEAVRIFTALKEDSPEGGWGDWGLGLAALAEGDTMEAAAFMREGYLRRPANLEAETAVLKHLVEHWLQDEIAPEEEAFLSLFSSFTSFRDCYRTRG